MEHCMHYTNYSRAGANPPDVVATCCNCGESAETPLFEMTELDGDHGDRVATEIQMSVNATDNPLGDECRGK